MSTEGANKESEVGTPACRWDYFTHPALRSPLQIAGKNMHQCLFFTLRILQSTVVFAGTNLQNSPSFLLNRRFRGHHPKNAEIQESFHVNPWYADKTSGCRKSHF
ncbi:hypothetical protein [Burkholderia pseudomallei]|uniref:hypothetical protein n=1 Tax=Burkholderia pseudomallei TaxID=28450 RepID=UPI00100C2C07|nr:hypothetical protein [Burkholderia pseudomallei]MCS6596444.1 hypothetical protein [Burkholderia pseudomallei]